MASQVLNTPNPRTANSVVSSYLAIDFGGLLPQNLTPEARVLLREYFMRALPGALLALISQYAFGSKHLLGICLFTYFFKIALPKIIVPLIALLKRDGPSGREFGSLILASLPLLAFMGTSLILVVGSKAWESLRNVVRDPGYVFPLFIGACGIVPVWIFFGSKIKPTLVAGYRKVRKVDNNIKLYRGMGLLKIISALSAIWEWSKSLLMRLRAICIKLRARLLAEQSSARFRHGALEGKRYIRLLRLHRRFLFAKDGAQMMHVSLDEAPSYDAISYTWGSSNLSKQITIDRRAFDIPESAFNAIEERRSFWRARVLWIDSICINQDDREEKAAQIDLMREIYQNASRVIISLGNGRNAHLLESLIDELVAMKLGNDRKFLTERVLRRYLAERESPRWMALRELFSQQWFERIWVAQELAFAARVDAVYGGAYLDWDALMEVAEMFHTGGEMDLYWLLQPSQEELPFIKPITPGHALLMNGLRANVSDNSLLSLAMLLLLLRTFKATLPGDKVFALLGLASPESYTSMGLVYTESPQQTYIRVARHVLVNEKQLLFLSAAGIANSDKQISNLPSWVPDWSTTPRAQSLALPIPSKAQYKAAGTTQPSLRMGSAPNTLVVAGKLVDRIAKTGSTHSGKRSHAQPFKAADILSWHDEALALAQGLRQRGSHPTGHPPSAFWRTLIGDFDVTSTRRPAPTEEYELCYQSWQVCMRDAAANQKQYHLNPASPAAEDEGPDRRAAVTSRMAETATFNLALSLCAEGRRFCVTERGFMGLVPDGSRAGDAVCVFSGGQTPSILRSDDGSGAHVLLGEAYFHGMMDGEMVTAEQEMGDVVLR